MSSAPQTHPHHRSSVTPNLNTVTTIRADGSRLFLHPADTRGRFTRLRRIAATVLVGIYLLLPWVKIGGHPAVFLDVGERRFHLFGLTLAAQDMWLMFFLISGVGFSLFIVTALLGRIWCGWACPQTVFLEHVFRRVERWLEGDAVQRRVLDEAPWTTDKVLRRVAKQLIFIVLSAGIAHLFIAYFVSVPHLWQMMTASPADHWGDFLFVMIATGILYFDFAWFREQLCIVICPYGRLQSALIDDNSMVIGYDLLRGEPRGKMGTANAGDCIDCARCIQVCPTGIDIRQGLQIECIGCTACVDACDEVMTRVKRPAGLIRYDSLNGFAGKATRWIRPRVVVYFVLLLIGAAVATWAFGGVRPANLGVTRMKGAPYYMDTNGVRNQFLLRLVNKKSEPARFHLRVVAEGQAVAVYGTETVAELGPLGEEVRPLIVEVHNGDYRGRFAMKVELTDEENTYSLVKDVQFIGPDPSLLRSKTDAGK